MATAQRRRKRRRARPDDSPARPAAGGRPPFAASYPRHPDLERLLSAFENGNYGYVRAEAPRVIERADEEAVRQAARDLRRRIDPEPTALFLWALGIALVVFLYAYYVGR